MTIKEAKENGFTHKGIMYGFIKVYAKDLNDFEPQITGVNLLYDCILFVVSYIDCIFELSDNFSLQNIEQI